MTSNIVQPVPPPHSGIVLAPISSPATPADYAAAFVYEEKVKEFVQGKYWYLYDEIPELSNFLPNREQYISEATRYRNQLVQAIGGAPLWAIDMQIQLAQMQVAMEDVKDSYYCMIEIAELLKDKALQGN
ncbi:hypothetical protein C8J56DRAFT_1028215 [Mycena floridula]|nr:hypothetical protein C8J56DRAFT_1028215 [Mycena floridula]